MRNESTRTTKATAAGTSYDEVLIYPLGVQDRALVCIPTGVVRNDEVVLAICAHGSGGTEQTINSTAMAATRDAMLDRGWIVMSAFAHDRAWANSVAQRDYQRLYTWATSQWQVTDVVLHGQSMGALSMLNIAARDAIPRIRGVVSIDGALNLGAAWAGTYKSQIRTAYGTTDDANYPVATAGHDPCLIDVQRFAGKRLFLSASLADTDIPKAQHSDVFEARVSGIAAELVYRVGTAEHVQAPNYFPEDAVAFLESGLVGAPAEPLPALPFGTTEGEMWAAVGGSLVQLTPS